MWQLAITFTLKIPITALIFPVERQPANFSPTKSSYQIVYPFEG